MLRQGRRSVASCFRSVFYSLPCLSNGDAKHNVLSNNSYLSSKSFSRVNRCLIALPILLLLVWNVAFVCLFLDLEVSGVIYYRHYYCKLINAEKPPMTVHTNSPQYYYDMNVTLFSSSNALIFDSVSWKEFCASSSKETTEECWEEHIGDDLSEEFDCYAIKANVDGLSSVRSINGNNDIQITTLDELKSSMKTELYWILPLAILFILFMVSSYIVYGFMYFEGRSRFSLDRFFRTVVNDPYALGDQSTYKLEESPNIQINIQDATEENKEVLLKLDPSTIHQNEEDTQMQELAFSTSEKYSSNSLHPVYMLLRSTSIEEHETVLYYERPSTKNIRRARRNRFRVFITLMVIALILSLVLLCFSLGFLFALNRVLLTICGIELMVVIAIFALNSFFNILPTYYGVHYIVTSSRAIIIEAWPRRLYYSIYWIPLENISSTWYGSLDDEDYPIDHVTLEDHKEGKLFTEITTNKENVNGILFEHSVDVKSIIEVIEEHQKDKRQQFSIE